MSLAFKEAKLGMADSGVVVDNTLIIYTSKPATPQITYNAQIPYEAKTSICNEIKVKRAAGQVDLNFTNLDVVNPHTIYYQIYVDGTLVVDRSVGFEIGAGSTLAKTELIYQIDPPDQNLNVQVSLWADTNDDIELDDHQVRAGIGAEQNAVVLEIEREYAQGMIANFGSTGITWTWSLQTKYSGVTFEEGNQTANLEIVSQMLPYSKLYLVPLADKFAYVAGISLV